MHTNGERPAWVDRLFDEVDAHPTERLRDTDLRAMSVDPVRARRFFQRHYGMTFQGYHRAKRLGLALGRLRDGADINEVAVGHGYESSSGFRDAFERTFGTPPGRGRSMPVIVASRIPTPLGNMIAAATQEGVCLLEFVDRRGLECQLVTLRKRLGGPILPGRNEHLDRLADEINEYFAGSLTEFSVPLVLLGTPFQESVWRQLRTIPFGETRSYESLARAVGRAGAVRAVGTANGANSVAIVVPCHRVIRKNGALGGYGGGLWRKEFLLDLEREGAQAAPDRGSQSDSNSASPTRRSVASKPTLPVQAAF